MINGTALAELKQEIDDLRHVVNHNADELQRLADTANFNAAQANVDRAHLREHCEKIAELEKTCTASATTQQLHLINRRLVRLQAELDQLRAMTAQVSRLQDDMDQLRTRLPHAVLHSVVTALQEQKEQWEAPRNGDEVSDRERPLRSA